jgi:integrase
LLSNGVPLATVSKRLGHADPSVTLRIYSHALPSDDHKATDAWKLTVDAADASADGSGDQGPVQ